ncbi:MAG: RNA polymerase sigma factor [Calditrichaceae bacterium]|nr:RNA polymerase sigma factor [Calditrichaceae bacterium]
MIDEQILQEIKKGNSLAYRELVMRYESQIASTVINMLGKSPEAEDIGQEVFIRFYKAIPGFRGESSVGTYLTRIAINLSLNEIKRRKRRKNIFVKKELSELINYIDENKPDVSGDKEMINRAIQSLNPKFRSVLVLRLIDGYSTDEVAKILKIPLGTVLSRLSRAQEKLKEKLTPLMEVSYG